MTARRRRKYRKGSGLSRRSGKAAVISPSGKALSCHRNMHLAKQALYRRKSTEQGTVVKLVAKCKKGSLPDLR